MQAEERLDLSGSYRSFEAEATNLRLRKQVQPPAMCCTCAAADGLSCMVPSTRKGSTGTGYARATTGVLCSASHQLHDFAFGVPLTWSSAP